MKNVYDITNEFEKRLAEYTGAPYVVTVDNQSNALFLALTYEKVKGQEITIPSRTYPSVPCEIIHAGAKVKFKPNKGKKLKGGSTISQQTAKNVFLWQGRSYLRKGLEAYFTVLIELIWGKERIMEVYLNSIEILNRQSLPLQPNFNQKVQIYFKGND